MAGRTWANIGDNEMVKIENSGKYGYERRVGL
jgi:hypothetical protein